MGKGGEMDIKKLLSKQIKIEGVDSQTVSALLGISPQEDMGDFCLPCFSLAKQLRQSPNEIAKNIANSLQDNEYFKEVQVLNGYVNFFLNQDIFVSKILKEVHSNLDEYGKKDTGKNQLACIEFSSINIAKNPHIGHLCGTVFGESFSRLHQNFGYKVKRLNYLGDYGTQFGKTIRAYQKWGDRADIEQRGVDALQELYIRANALCEEDEAFLDECRQVFLRLEQGDKEIQPLYDWFVQLSLNEAKQIYNVLGINFDDWRGESYYAQFNDETMDKLRQKQVVRQDRGATIVDLEQYGLGVAVVQQTSGASLYITRDISTLFQRYQEYDFDKMVYVVAVEQRQHFMQLFKISELLGADFLEKVSHISYGMVSLPEGRISSRKGSVALIKDLFKMSTERAQEILTERGTIAQDAEKLSGQIGVSALVFHILRSTTAKDSVFDAQKAINFDGETGPYLQYTYARCCSLLRNWKEHQSNQNEENESSQSKDNQHSKENQSNENKDNKSDQNEQVDFTLLSGNVWNIVKLIEKFPSVLQGAFEDYEPCYIARFAISLASEFNKFYNENRIITEDAKLSATQIELTRIVGEILGKSLYFMVMDAPDKM